MPPLDPLISTNIAVLAEWAVKQPAVRYKAFMSRRIGRAGLIPPSPSEAEYAGQKAQAEGFGEAADPIALFLEWFQEASRREPSDPHAMSLATVDGEGMPDARTVLLKGVDEAGFVFYTNLSSAKGRQLAANPKAALLFHWKSLQRQVRVRGTTAPVSDEEADAYFATRARTSQIGAWASDQSQPMPDPLALEKALARYGVKFALGEVPRPPGWSGFRLTPVAIEFWRSRRFRLHERLAFTRPAPGHPWGVARLFP
jgi:pyridoxamine 5'-phosphate oxidase